MCDLKSGAEAAASAPGSPDIRLCIYTAADRRLLDSWLGSPSLAGWWGSRASAEARIRLAQDSRTAICAMIVGDGEAIGYAQACEGVDALPAHCRVPLGAWSCDILIGAEAYRGRGLGQRALGLLALEVFETTLATACTIVVPLRNERAVRACERLGFKWTGVEQDPVAGPAWVMSLDRSRR